MGPLFIKDEEVNRLATLLQKLTKAKSKTAAVKHAIEQALIEARGEAPMRRQIAKAKAKVSEMGDYVDPDFDQKAFSDELWGDQ